MKTKFLTVILLFSATVCNSQSKKIIGSWIWRDSANTIQFFINRNGTIEKRSGGANEYIWNKTPQSGTYVFNKGHILVIRWTDKSIENGRVKFINDMTAEIQFSSLKNKPNRIYTFHKIVDEEVIPDK